MDTECFMRRKRKSALSVRSRDVCSLCGVAEYGKATAVVRITAVGVDAPDSMRDFKKI